MCCGNGRYHWEFIDRPFCVVGICFVFRMGLKERTNHGERKKARLKLDKMARNVSLVGESYVCMCISLGPVLCISSTQDQATESLAQQRLESAPLCLQASKGYVKTLRRVDSMVIVSKTPCCSRERFSDGVVFFVLQPNEPVCSSTITSYIILPMIMARIIFTIVFVLHSSFFCGGKTKYRC